MITNANLILFAVLLCRRAEQKKLVRRVISSAPAARGSRRDMEFEDLNERAMRGGHAGQLNAWSSR